MGLGLAVSISIGALASAPFSSGAAATPARIAKLGLCDYSNLAASNPSFVASHFNSAVIGAASTGTVSALHAVNPNLEVVGYLSSITTEVSVASSHPASSFLVDPQLQARLLSSSTGINEPHVPVYVMDPASKTWQAEAAAAVSLAYARGEQGLLLDLVFGSLTELWPTAEPEGHANYQAVPSWYTDASWQASMKSFLKATRKALGPKGTLAINGLAPLPGNPELTYAGLASVAIEEGWAYDRRREAVSQSPYVTGSDWQRLLDTVLAAPAKTRITVQSYGPLDDPAARNYALGSFLLAERKTWAYAYAPDCRTLTWFPEYGLDLGAPKGNAKSAADLTQVVPGVYDRRFTKGRVLVNPSASDTATVALGQTCTLQTPSGSTVAELGGDATLSVSAVRSVTLGPHSAAIFTACTKH